MNLFQTSVATVFVANMIVSPSVGASARPSPVRSFKPIPEFLGKGLSWLAKAQFENGGWGSGAHAHQEIRDPKSVQIDPAATAFSAMALLRSGSTLQEGPYAKNVSRALNYLIDLVESSPDKGSNITSLTGTQIQSKLGQNIDVSMTAQFFTKILPHTSENASLNKRLKSALEKCLRKIERGQTGDGSWSGAGWAGVLQSSMANSALEAADASGIKVDEKVLEKSRDYQKGNVDIKTGEVKTEGAAGVSLYAITSNQRATAQEARDAELSIDEAKSKGLLRSDAPVSQENLMGAGHSEKDARRLADAYKQNKQAQRMLEDETVMSGFGNNGGEEFLSYMMTAESMAITGDKEYDGWHKKMSRRFDKIQEGNGSWSGHHCITSPVFCSAAVILTLTADRDAQILVKEKREKRNP